MGIAVDLAGRGLEDSGVPPLGQPQHIDGAQHRGLGGGDRVVLIMNRAGRTSEVKNAVHFDIQRQPDVVTNAFEAFVPDQMADVVLATRVEIIDTEHLLPIGN
ncbi:hypothetical protein D3C78_953460 [compost metagenome]